MVNFINKLQLNNGDGMNQQIHKRITMLKFLHICLFLAFFGCLSATEKIFDIPKMENIKIDGKNDDWGSRGMDAGIMAPVNDSFAAPKDSSVRIHVGWDEQGLLFLIDLVDDCWDEHEKEFWRQDSIEIFLIPDRKGNTVCQWVISPGMSAQYPELRWQIYDNCYKKKLDRDLAKPEIGRIKKNDHHCVIEARLPWTSIGISPQNGKEFALQFWVNDYDGEEVYRSLWFPDTGTYAHAAKSNQCRLSEKATEPYPLKAFFKTQIDNSDASVNIIALRKFTGRTVEIKSDYLNEKAVLKDNSTGYCSASIKVPLSLAGREYKPISVFVDGKKYAECNLSDARRKIAEYFLFEKPLASPGCVFSGSK